MSAKKPVIITVIIIYIIISISINDAEGLLKVHFIDVGHGDCILIQTPDDKVMLIDTGREEHAGYIENYLKKNNVKEINVLVITHPHKDHIGSTAHIVRNFKIHKMYMPDVSQELECFYNAIRAIKDRRLEVMLPVPGEHINFSSSVTVTIFAPNKIGYKRFNNNSIVLKLSYGNISFLFTGDAEAQSEKEMIEKDYDLKSTVLKVAHHGINTSSIPVFLRAAGPQYAVISDSVFADEKVLDDLKYMGAVIYRTGKNGTIVMICDGHSLEIVTK
ncbi:MAG: MBL fold metallo-hydrolase [Candidatus Eremiobacterota bacterium]